MSPSPKSKCTVISRNIAQVQYSSGSVLTPYVMQNEIYKRWVCFNVLNDSYGRLVRFNTEEKQCLKTMIARAKLREITIVINWVGVKLCSRVCMRLTNVALLNHRTNDLIPDIFYLQS